jgi:polar amino acid transport system substrate-binding protein
MRKRLLPALAVGFSLFLTAARADTLDDIRQRGILRWGADQEGGGPYVYPSADDPNRVKGFEKDLMDVLAKRLGVRAEFVQAEWENLPDVLRRGEIDVIANGYELTPGRQQTMIATIPYYIYELQLIARKNDASVTSWEDLKASATRKKVGVLGGSAAQQYVEKHLGDRVEVILYNGFTNAMQEVQTRKLDATVQDLPPTVYYRDRYPDLHAVGAPVGPGYYVLYLRKGDERLRDELNATLRELSPNGSTLRAIYKRYGIWNDTQEKLGSRDVDLAAAEQAPEKSKEFYGWDVVWRNLPLLGKAAAMTVMLSILSMPLAIGLGLLIALGRLYGPGLLRWLLTGYVEVLRGTPLMLQLYTIFFVLPSLGVKIDAVPAAILGLAINYSAYESEIYRAGLLAIPIGQMEAALALGMSRRVALRRIIVPQAVRLVVPPVTNDFIALFKDTSICSVITVVELTKRYSILANSTGAYLELAAVTALLYLLMSYPLSLIARRLERRTRRVIA